ncbi:hypothetical protein C1J05_09305 [Sulfitobacter sp. JL08]|uniref:hypothetical protein n=1 Tax=Sulfitobacter sp. JL08 TaxID=2070369 RepID=UPI000E0A4F3D|nr:hypothetical protein [Sulfitobacter sp. JL08]AXI54665.1 hypothetical protein C1J05_09305 [Sulfitobacter sp. JL08]
MEKTRVVFVHKQGHVHFGAKVMRCDQMAQISSRYLGDKYTFEIASPPKKKFAVRQRRFAKGCSDAIVILLKNAAQSFTPEALDILRRSARGVCIDHVDAPINSETLGLPDVHIAASRKSEMLLKKRLEDNKAIRSGITVAHLCHHADLRLVAASDTPDKLEIGYFGNIGNTLLPAQYENDVHVYPFTKTDEFSSVLRHFQESRLHYGVRGASARPAIERRMAKPFTKGFNAAAVGANILVNRQVDDAIHYLGDDYPYLVDDLTEQSIGERIDFARSSYGGPDWQRGLNVMADVREKSSPAAVAREMEQILAVFN